MERKDRISLAFDTNSFTMDTRILLLYSYGSVSERWRWGYE